MPVKIPTTLPARATLERENIFIMDEERATHQDIRPLRVAILNLMPTKITTETQLLRLLSNSALQVEVTLLHTATYESKNTDAEHLLEHYVTFKDIEKEKVDGLQILAESDDAGVYIVGTKDGRHLFITGHSEYDPLTLKAEYDRDVNKGLPIHVPRNYYPNDDPKREPTVRWRGHANLLY